MAEGLITHALDTLRRGAPANEALRDTLTRIAHATVRSVNADMAALTLLDMSGRPATVAFTDDAAPELDQAQYDSGRGPCLEAARTGTLVRVDSVDTERRWPEFATAARQLGISCGMSLPLAVDGEGIGALNLYARTPNAFNMSAEDFGQAFATEAALAIGMGVAYWEKATLAEQLQEAMDSRAQIEQAKGIIMASTGCSADEAFTMLREQSQAENVKLRDLAAALVRRPNRVEP